MKVTGFFLLQKKDLNQTQTEDSQIERRIITKQDLILIIKIKIYLTET